MEREVQRGRRSGSPGALSWSGVSSGRWWLWVLGVVCLVVSYQRHAQGNGVGVFGAAALVCFVLSVPRWRWPLGRAARGRPYFKAVADHKARMSAIEAAERQRAPKLASVREVPARFREEGEAIFARWPTGDPAPGSAVAFADRYDTKVRQWRDLERFAAGVEQQAETREEHTYAARLRAWIDEATDAARICVDSSDQARVGLIEQLVSLGPDVPAALLDAHREELASWRRLHHAFMVRDPETRQAALALIAVVRDEMARERDAFGMTRRQAARYRR